MFSTKKILLLGESGSGKLTFLKALTGTLPATIPATHGGLTHELSIKNAYYTANIGIWVDEISPEGVEALCDSYSSDEAREVRQLLGVIVLTFHLQDSETKVSKMLEQVKRIAHRCAPETILLAVGTSKLVKDQGEGGKSITSTTEPVVTSIQKSDLPSWDDLCLDEGFEFIDLTASGKNTFGEEQGVKRALQAIETCDWSNTVEDPSEEELLAEMLAEDAALNEKLLDVSADGEDKEPNDKSIEDLERMMQRVLLAREHLQDLSPEERKKQAVKLVSEIMR